MCIKHYCLKLKLLIYLYTNQMAENEKRNKKKVRNKSETPPSPFTHKCTKIQKYCFRLRCMGEL